MPPQIPSTSSRRYTTIEAWRGLAALSVLLFHSFGGLESQKIWLPLESLRRACGYGWLGLYLFFVISGYCIFERLFHARSRRETFSAFGKDRFLRIFPIYWAILAFTLALNLAAWPFNRGRFHDSFPSSLLEISSNLSLTHVLVGQPVYVLVSWTLACEIVFYLFAGLIWTISDRVGGISAALGIGLALCAAGAAPVPQPWFLPLALWPDFFAGACVSMILISSERGDRKLVAAGTAALVILSGAAIFHVGKYDSDPYRVAFAFAWVLLALHRWDRKLAALGPAKALSWIGAFSYSLYLIHVQILSHMLNLGTRAIPPLSAFFGLLWIASVVAAVGGGWFFWRMVELRFERYRRQSLPKSQPFKDAASLAAGSV